MKKWLAFAALACAGVSLGAEMTPPKAGKVDILPLKDVKPGMQSTAWTVFLGTQPEAMPLESVGVWKRLPGSQAGRHHLQAGR